MSELYWICRIGIISSISTVIFGVSFCALLIVFLVHIINKFESYYYEEELEEFNAKLSSIVLKIIPIVTISALVAIFVPSKDELIMIYGIGGTIDYIQNNDKAKELPDKVINALDMYLDNINKEKDD